MDFFSRVKLEKYGTITISGETAYYSRRIIPVPMQWAAREKWVEILRSSSARKAMDPAIREKNPVEMQWVLPRLSCFMPSLSYDSSRKIVKTQDIGTYLKSSSASSRPVIYSPVPYNLNLELTSISRNMDDNLQIMEQILPYFSPSMSLNIKLFPDRESESIPIILDSISSDIPLNIHESDERFFTTTYNFTVRMNYYFGNIPDQGMILNIDTNLITKLDLNNINIKWLEDQQKIETKFNYYVTTANSANPFLNS